MKELTKLEVLALNKFKKEAIVLGNNGVSSNEFKEWYGHNRVGILFNKDGHCAEVVCAYMCGLVGANTVADAQADFRGVDLVVNGLPIQIKYDWEKGSWDFKYEGRTWTVDSYREPIVVVYPGREDNGIDALSRLLQSDVRKIRLSAEVKRTIISIWFWFSHNTDVKR